MKKTVCVIEDNHSIVEVIDIFLKEQNYNVEIITEPTDMEKICKVVEKSDVVFLDVALSGVDGIEVSKSLKQNEKTKNVPIILMTAGIHIEEKAKQAQADDYLKKPFSIDLFLELTKKYAKG
jgi:DNA-binding response OmpR family regulator